MNIKNVKGFNLKQTYILLSLIMVLVFTGIIAYIGKDKPQISANTEVTLTKEKSNLMMSQSVDDIAAVVQNHSTNSMVRLPAYILKVNGEDVGIFSSEEEISFLLDTISKTYLDNSSEVKNIDYKEDVYIVKTTMPIDEFNNRETYEDVLYNITRGTSEKRIHKVEKGENYWSIAKKYKIKPSDLIKANPDVVPERLQIGQEISLVVPKPLITTTTSEIVKYTNYIDFETEYEETDKLFKGEYRLKKAGEKGEKIVEAEVSKENGIEVSRNILSEDITKQPVTKVVVKGTKDPPPKIGTGVLSKPTSRGYITSPFGMRWGKRHTGIDIGMPIGTDVKAADGGKGIYSGYKGGYGYCVIIDHGANVRTLYAHNSELKVKKGQKIYKGQTIAESGNSGRSTGPHLHFEVIKNGTPVNPSNYVSY